MKRLRLVPLVTCAAAGLLALKLFGLLTAGNYLFGSPRAAQAETVPVPAFLTTEPETPRIAEPLIELPALQPRRSRAQDINNYPDLTGSVAKAEEREPGAAAKPVPPSDPRMPATEIKQRGAPEVLDLDRLQASAGERAVLESLNQRRQELEARARELDVRESLLKAAEKKIEVRLADLKDIEGRVNAAAQKKDEAEAARFKGLVIMYENMKAKDAARIFDRLDLRILMELSAQINPRRMSDILAQMLPEVAERLSSEIANRSGAIDRGPATSDLPKIEGRPNGT